MKLGNTKKINKQNKRISKMCQVLKWLSSFSPVQFTRQAISTKVWGIIYFCTHKSYGYLLNMEQNNLAFLKTCNTEFDDITVTFTDQNGTPLETEDKVNLTLLINKERWHIILEN